MALIKCPECGKGMSDRAECCPQCGMPINEVKATIQSTFDKSAKKRKILRWLALVSGIVFVIGIAFVMFTRIFGLNISTAEDWVRFSKNHTKLNVIYNRLEKISPDNLIEIYSELSSAVGNGNTIKNYSDKDVCLAYWYIYAFIPMDSDVNKGKYSVAQMDKFESIMNRQADRDAQQNTTRHIGENKMIEILKSFASLSGSMNFQSFLELYN